MDVRQFVKKEIDNHRKTFDPGNIRDLVDLYLQAEKNGFKDHEGMDGKCICIALNKTILNISTYTWDRKYTGSRLQRAI